ncbi:MAG: peptide chain release factor 3 [Oscillospiraceae bacterium]|nr:peptide chain release factor 3 [Oscillospiraceae bacterium]
METQEEIKRRRTFAIISHPDAGKTTLTEKLLLYGGAIQQAGAVKGKAAARHAVSDWMELEKQRGISVTSSVMQFDYRGYCINILDTPGHQDFSEDTYRTLMAADSAVMVIDAAKGIEPQTRKLFKICAMRHIPIFTFINKLDREALSSFELLEQLEKEFGIGTYPFNWPVGCGQSFRGVYDRQSRSLLLFNEFHHGQSRISAVAYSIDDREALDGILSYGQYDTLLEETELLDGAGYEFDIEQVRSGKLSPVFFGSALNNFGVEQFLNKFIELTVPPLPRMSGDDEISPFSDGFSAFVFKIQANMNKAHRDRIAFFRICSGKFERDREYYHVQQKKTIKLAQPQQLMAQDRSIIDEAYAGDIIGVFDPGVFSIGDTVCEKGMNVTYEGIPTFAPEHFASVERTDTMKRKQFEKGIMQIAQEGAIQIFHEPFSGIEEVIVGVVGVLQFEVLEYRLRTEYGVEIRRRDLPYECIRWIDSAETAPDRLNLTSDTKWVQDYRGNNLLLFTSSWCINWALQKNDGLVLREFNRE